MKKSILLLLVMLLSYTSYSQEKEHPPLLQTPSNWGSEFFDLPTGFAREMTFTGYEEATFPKGWGTVDSPQFWSYVFAWFVDTTQPLNISDLEQNLDLYFNGLMHGREEPNGNPNLPTITLVMEETEQGDLSTFVGKVRLFEGFKTKEMITLHMRISQEYCPIQKKAMVVFRFSPKTYEDPIWKDLNNIIPIEGACDQ